jgi:hypothetical protein
MFVESLWTVAAEWTRWVEVERVASDGARLAELSREYLAADERSFKPFVDEWPRVIASHMETG